MIENYGNKYKYIWCLNDKRLMPDEYKEIPVVSYLSFKYIYHSMTAGFVIDNSGGDVLPFRKEQKIINTWHGGGAYKNGHVDSVYKKRKRAMENGHKIRAKMISYIISSCERFTYYQSIAWNVPEKKFLPIGMPRNDILFFDVNDKKQKIYEYYHINKDAGIILYAPTYRGDHRSPGEINSNIDLKKVSRELALKYDHDFVFLFRSHHAIKKTIKLYNVIFVSDYPDMQELLCAADVLITDYSSSIWDFSFTHKPCFLYTPDLAKYESKTGFNVPIRTWPFPLAETNQELIENIRNFDSEEYIDKVNKHHKELGSYETGHAAEQFYKLLFE